MIVDGRIRFKDVLEVLEVESIPGCETALEEWIDFTDCVDVEESELPECDLCNGDGRDDPEESAVNPWLIRDFVAAIRAGDLTTAQCLVGRVFELDDDVGVTALALCRCTESKVA